MDNLRPWWRTDDEEEQQPAAPFTPPAVAQPQSFWDRPETRGALGLPTAPTQAPATRTPTVLPERIAAASAEADRGWSSRTASWLDRGLRFVSSIASPLAAAQDIFFATTEGLLDPNVSLWENWRELDWAHYTPWTPAPTRPTTGSDFVRALGVTDPSMQRWFGLVADLAVDPLAFGSAVRAVGKVTGTAASLNRVADAMDTVSQATMLVGGVPTARVARTAMQVAPRAVRSHVQRNMDDLGRVFARVINANIPANPGAGTEAVSLGSLFIVDAGRSQAAVDVLSRTRGASSDVLQDVNERLAQVLSAVGDNRAGRWMREIINSQSLHYRIPRMFGNYDPDMSNALLRSVYDTARQVSVTEIEGAVRNLPDGARRLFEEATDIMIQAGPGAPPQLYQTRRQGVDLLWREEERIAKLATSRGLDADDVVTHWRHALQKVAEADALTGYHASGLQILREVFYENLLGQGFRPAQIRDAWMGYLRETMAGRGEQWLTTRVGNTKLKGADVFGRYGNAFALNANALIENIPQGHLRRAFGNFLDPQQFQRYEKALRDGNLVPARIIDETKVLNQLQTTMPKQTAQARAYLEMMTPSGARGAAGNAQGMSMVVNTTELMESMVRSGSTPAEARLFVEEMVKAMHPELADLAGDVAFYRQTRVGDVPAAQGMPASARSAFKPRQALDTEELDVLLEAADPALSISQAGLATRSAMNTRNAMAELLRIAEKQGAIMKVTRDNLAPQGWKTIPLNIHTQFPMLGPFAGSAMHPIMYREVMNLAARSKSPNAFWSGWNKLRGMITGGWLANPATTVTNVAGGFLTAWLHGVPLPDLARDYIGVLRDVAKHGRNLPEYEAVGDLIDGALTANDILQRLPRMASRLKDSGTFRANLQRIAESWVDAYSDTVLRPRGAASFLGLRHFQASEALIRMATYRTMMRRTGDAAQARRMARFVTFDYTAQPQAIETLKNFGVMAFPAFPFFMMGRTVNAALKYPGRLAAVERMPGAIWEFAIPDEEKRAQAYAALDEWMRTGKYIPLYESQTGKYTMFPFGNFLPTDTIGKDAFYDSLSTIGILGPFIDVLVATLSDDRSGEALITGRFGRRVFQETATPTQKFGQTMQFLYNSLAPGWARKMFRFSENPLAGPTGLIPEGIDFARNGIEYQDEFGQTAATMSELLRRRPDRSFLDEIIGFTLRSVRPVSAAPGATSGAARQLEFAANDLQRRLSDLATQVAVLRDQGRTAQAERLTLRIGQLVEEFEEKYGPMKEILQRQRDVYPGVQR